MKAKESSFRFSKPELVEFFFSENENFDENNFQAIEVRTKTNIVMSSANVNAATVSLTLSVEEENSPFRLNVIMRSGFQWNEDDLEYVTDFLRISAPSLLVSYIRPIIATITANSKYPIWQLPFLDLRENQMENENFT